LAAGVARAAESLQVLVGVKQWRQRLAHVPFDIVRERAKQNVGAHTVFEAVVDGPDAQVDALDVDAGVKVPDRTAEKVPLWFRPCSACGSFRPRW
jgi:hypothetical protein